MTDFGHRALSDPEFNEQYKEQMKQFKQRILKMIHLRSNSVI